MSTLCNTFIDKCISAQCENQMYPGVAPEALLINYDQVAQKHFTGSILDTLVMGEDKDGNDYCAYCVQQLSRNPYEGSQVEMTEGTYGNRFTRTFVFAINDNGPAASDTATALANGRFIAIMKGDYVHDTDADTGTVAGDNKYLVYGASKGLRASSIVRELYGDNEAAYIVTMTEEGAPTAEHYFFVTDETTTDTAYEALKCDCCKDSEESDDNQGGN